MKTVALRPRQEACQKVGLVKMGIKYDKVLFGSHKKRVRNEQLMLNVTEENCKEAIEMVWTLSEV